jgi:NitT/TauT family transport system substrate-binding protein
MRIKIFVLAALVISLTLSTASSVMAQKGAPREKVIMSYQAKTMTSYFIPEMARRKGFFQAEGLDVELIYVRGGQVDLSALLAGQSDFSVGGGAAISAFVAGAPIRLVVNFINQVDQALLAQPKFVSVKDLKGQIIASQNPGGFMDTLLRQILGKNGLNPDRDVVFINMGGSPERYQALKSGSVAATILGTPHTFRAEKEGFRMVAAARDYVAGSVSSLVVRADRVAKKRDQVKKTIRASLKTMGYIREHRKEAVDVIMREFGMDQEFAVLTYEQFLQLMSPDGSYAMPAVQFLIDLARKSQKVEREIPASQALDLAVLHEVQRELGLSR